MKHIIETNEIATPLPIEINGHPLTCGRWKAKMIGSEHKPYFEMGFRQDIARAEPETETEITLTFRGEDSIRLRAALQALISGQNV